MDTHRRFDAPAPPSTITSSLALLRARWAVAFAVMVVIAIVGAAAVGLVFVDRLKTVLIEAAVASTPLYVVVDARATGVEVDALGPLIKALPAVDDAALRPRDAALQALVANGMPAPDGRNPLPDVWVARLRATPVAAGGSGLASVVADARRALAALPQVDAVRVDERWVGRADNQIADLAPLASRALTAAAALLAVLLACTAVVGSAAFATRASKSVVTLALFLVAFGAIVIDVAAAAIGATGWTPVGDGPVAMAWARIVASGTGPALAIGVAVLAITVVAAAVTPRVRDSE